MSDSYPTGRYHDLLLSEDTIVAPATPPGLGAIAIIRLSGPQAPELLRALFSPHGRPRQSVMPRRMTYGWLRDGEDLIDEVQVCFYPAPASYTGEDTVEIFAHGSPAVIRRAIEALVSRGARAAEPGEFTLRAFRNGRVDLARAEAVNELVRAETQMARRLALHALRGGLDETLDRLRADLESIVVAVETELEFETDAAGADADRELRHRLGPCRDALLQLVDAGRRQQRHPRGAVVAIAGKPNVGKSSLLNCILSRERAIVSAVPGTTRDTLEETIEFEGAPLLFVDTAGVYEATSEPDALALKRTLRTLGQADIVLHLVDLSSDLDSRDLDILERLRRTPPAAAIVSCANKSDLLPTQHIPRRVAELRGLLGVAELLPISALTGANVQSLLRHTSATVKACHLLASDIGVLVTGRQTRILDKAVGHLQEAMEAHLRAETLDVIAEAVRRAFSLVGQIRGDTCDADVLDAVFARFCVGK